MKDNKQSDKIYKIGIDARFFGLENKGLGRYTNELVEKLDKLLNSKDFKTKNPDNSQIEFYIFLLKNKLNKYQTKSKNIHKIQVDYKWYSWKEQILFPFLLRKYNLDLMHFPHFNVPFLYRGDFVVTVHDLILFHYPTVKNTTLSKFYYLVKLATYHFLIRWVVHRAKQIITISKFTKKDLIKTLGVPESKIKVIYEGASFDLSEGFDKGEIICNKNKRMQRQDEIFKKYGIMKPYLLYVGNAYPHKNLEKLCLAWQMLCRRHRDKNNVDFPKQLVLVGKRDFFYHRLREFLKNNQIKNVLITGHLSDKKLNTVYCEAKLFVFSSLYEGFGLPPLEALARGIPVVSSGNTSLPEILGERVIYCDPTSITSIMKAMEMGLKSGHIISVKERRKLMKEYNWSKMVNEVLDLYFNVLLIKNQNQK